MRFAEFITEQKNTHMTHIEDKVLYGGVDGTRQAILALRSLRDMLGGVKEGSASVKWDGAPAIFAGIDPRDGSAILSILLQSVSEDIYKSENLNIKNFLKSKSSEQKEKIAVIENKKFVVV